MIEYYKFWLLINLEILPFYIFLIFFAVIIEIMTILVNTEKEIKGYEVTKKLDDFKK